jgi:hypothetical protein
VKKRGEKGLDHGSLVRLELIQASSNTNSPSIPLASSPASRICCPVGATEPRGNATAPEHGEEGHAMRIQEESRPLGYHAPNAILERMRRRISRVGLLVAFVSALLVALLIFVVCACKSARL